MAKEDATEGEMWKVLEQTKLADFLRQEEGLDTKLLEKASNLSGGQRQRLALARALLHDSPIYIFDEATSNIDVESENDIMERIIALAKTKTVLLISHRLANVVGADRIYVLEKGQIVEVGQHESLLQEQKLTRHSGRRSRNWKITESLRKEEHRHEKEIEFRDHGKTDRHGTSASGLYAPCHYIRSDRTFIGILYHYFCRLCGIEGLGISIAHSFAFFFVCMVVFAIARGFARYTEQSCNHYIAFKLLALIRAKAFAALRRLCPAKLEGRDKGDLISVITSDIELLEVFYAHTISPIAIATIYSVILSLFIGHIHWGLGLLALAAYVTVGVTVPVIASKTSGDLGLEFRNQSGSLSAFVLDSLRGLPETMQYGNGKKRMQQMNERTDRMNDCQEKNEACDWA